MDDSKKSLLYRLYVWLRRNTVCRLGYHSMRTVFHDTGWPNFDTCEYCDLVIERRDPDEE